MISEKEASFMKKILANLGLPTSLGFLLMAPFMCLALMFDIAQRLNTFSFKDAVDFIVVFGLLWLGMTAIVFILRPIVRNVRAGESLLTHPAKMIFAVAALSCIAFFVGGVIVDQYPCWLGVPNCD